MAYAAFLNSRRAVDRPEEWFLSFNQYIQETKVSTLDLSNMGLNTGEVAAILEFLADSQVVELDLSHNNLRNGMETLAALLVKTPIRKVKFNSCQLLEEETLELVQTLKDTQISHLDLGNNNFKLADAAVLTAHLADSNLGALSLENCAYFGRREEAALFSDFFEALGVTKLTHLNLNGVLRTFEFPELLLSWFRGLAATSITHLSLADNNVGRCDLSQLGDSFRSSKLTQLDLSNNCIDDEGLNALFQALEGSKVSALNLSSNSFHGCNDLAHLLKRTQIATLDLSETRIIHSDMFNFPEFVRDSSVVSLNLNRCNLLTRGASIFSSLDSSKVTELDVSKTLVSYTTLVQLASVLNRTDLKVLKFAESFNLSAGEDELVSAFASFGEAVATSNLQSIDFGGPHVGRGSWQLIFASFLAQLEKSSVVSLRLYHSWIDSTGAEMIARHLANSRLTHVDLEDNAIAEGAVSLVENLRRTAVTHLNLKRNRITAEVVGAFTEHLKATKIIDLNLSCNILHLGLTAFAQSLKDTNICSLDLSYNGLDAEELSFLADCVKDTSITTLKIVQDPTRLWDGHPAEAVVWHNRRRVHHLVHVFTKIVPKSNDSLLRFEDLAGTADTAEFLEECLHFYKLATQDPSAVKILRQAESVDLSEARIAALLFDEFPEQFAQFIARNVEADASEHVRFLRKVEEFELGRISELLLLNRPLYTIDERNSILHPFVYILLDKYKLTICNLDVEPQGLRRIIEYFTRFPDIEGGSDVIGMLQDKLQTMR